MAQDSVAFFKNQDSVNQLRIQQELFLPIFHPNPIVVAILVIATGLPFAPIKPITCVEEISIQITSTTPCFLSRYGLNLAKKPFLPNF